MTLDNKNHAQYSYKNPNFTQHIILQKTLKYYMLSCFEIRAYRIRKTIVVACVSKMGNGEEISMSSLSLLSQGWEHKSSKQLLSLLCLTVWVCWS
jgi:hypothetical protein